MCISYQQKNKEIEIEQCLVSRAAELIEKG